MDKPTRPPSKLPSAASKPAIKGAPPAAKPGVAKAAGGKSGGLAVETANSAPKAPVNVGRPPWYKRKYLVYPQFQMTLIILNTAVTMALFGLIAYMVIRSHLYLENLVKQTRLPAQNLFIQLLTDQLRSLLIYMFVALGIGLVTTATFTLLLSHKMAGPMIRLKLFFGQVSKSGEFPDQLKFREGDFFQELPPAINTAFNISARHFNR